jgi:hypothetical protein
MCISTAKTGVDMSITITTAPTFFTFKGYDVYYIEGVRIYRTDAVINSSASSESERYGHRAVPIDSFQSGESEHFGERLAQCIQQQNPTVEVEVRYIIWLFMAGYLSYQQLLDAERDGVYIFTDIGIEGRSFNLRVVDTSYAR